MTRLSTLLLAVLLTGATPAPLAADVQSPTGTPWSSGSSPDATRPNGAPSAKASIRDASSNLAGVPLTEGGIGTALMAGNIGWAEPDLGIDYLATRFPRGTLVEICGPNACLIRRTNDYGPVASIRPNRIADLAVLDWERICGLPRSRGLCKGTVETVAEIVLPATDTAPEAP